MRRRRSRLRPLAAAAYLGVGTSIGLVGQARAQSGAATEALDLLLPTGARALGMGQAAVAFPSGAEGLWWNPALIARAPREVSFHFAQTLATEGDYTLAALIPVQYVGAVAVSARYIDFGVEQ